MILLCSVNCEPYLLLFVLTVFLKFQPDDVMVHNIIMCSQLTCHSTQLNWQLPPSTVIFICHHCSKKSHISTRGHSSLHMNRKKIMATTMKRWWCHQEKVLSDDISPRWRHRRRQRQGVWASVCIDGPLWN